MIDWQLRTRNLPEMLASDVGQVVGVCKPRWHTFAHMLHVSAVQNCLYACFILCMLFFYTVAILNCCKMATLLLQIFFIVVFFILHAVFTCVVHNCLRVWLSGFLHFAFVCTIAFLTYFLKQFYALIHAFYCQYAHILHLFNICRFLAWVFAVCALCLSFWLPVFCLQVSNCLHFVFRLPHCFVVVCFLLFFPRFVCCIFLQRKTLVACF